MLNELLEIERGLAAAGIPIAAPHPDVQQTGKGEILRVRLGAEGQINSLEPITPEAQAGLWTLRDGNHNSFPHLKTPRSLLPVPIGTEWAKDHAKQWKALNSAADKRTALRQLVQDYPFDRAAWADWPTTKHLARVAERRMQLEPLRNGDTAAVPAAFNRFLAAAAQGFVPDLMQALLTYAEERDETWIEPVHRACLESCTLYIDVPETEFDRDVGDRLNVEPVSRALGGAEAGPTGRCSLTGTATTLHRGNFPKRILPSIGLTILFAKNSDIAAAFRYGRADDQAFPVGKDLVERLAGSIDFVVEKSRQGLTWRVIPGESGKGDSDLLVAFIPADPDLPVAGMLTDAEADGAAGAYAALTKRVVKELDGTIDRDFAQEQVQICIIRKVDPANRKVIYHRQLTAEAVHEAAKRWLAGCANVPVSLAFPVPDGKSFRDARPPRVAPAALPAATRVFYADGGTRPIQVIGCPASDGLALLFEEGAVGRRARALLRLFLTRHGTLLAQCAHAAHKGPNHLKTYDPKADLRPVALRSITWIAVLLHKLDRPKEKYMGEPAFRLGQLLAAADAVHVGYCADLRGGDVPPVLLGNSVLTIAQANPTKALAILGRRWKPYGGWAKRIAAIRTRADRLVASKDRADQDRGWAMRRALSYSARVPEISAELSGSLPARTSEPFRAELLLGYIAGLPKSERSNENAIEVSEGSSQ